MPLPVEELEIQASYFPYFSLVFYMKGSHHGYR